MKEFCKKCGKQICTEEVQRGIDADQSIDCGEFSGSHDYDLCECNESHENNFEETIDN